MREINAGTVIAGKYRVERPLTQGGMGSLWVARQLQLQRFVAIKLMEPSLAASAEGRSRFEREAQAAASIQSPHVVQIHDYGVEEGTPYIVMELLEGEDLGRRLKRERRLPLPVLAHVFGQIAKALRKAHDVGMIHLDLKPANIFLARDDEDEIVKVLDFGIAKMVNTGNATEATATGVVLGSVHYMSPEQARGRRGLDHRSDLWSLGVIAFRAITGELPFGGTQIGDVLMKVCADPIPRASAILPGLSPAIDAFLLRALERDPDARFQSVRELAAALALLAWPRDPRPPQPSVMVSDPAPIEPTRVVVVPAVAPAPAPFAYAPSVAAAPPPQASTTQWRPPAEAGTLTSSPLSDLTATSQRVPATNRSWRWAVVAAFGIVSILAAGLIGSVALSDRQPKATTNAAATPDSAPPSEPPPPPALAPAATATATAREVEIEVAPPPAKTAEPAATTAPRAPEKPASPPMASAQSKPRSAPPPAPPPTPAPKKLNPALGF